jgi:polyketide synthase PksN
MNSKRIFEALESGEISLEQAEAELMEMMERNPEQSAKNNLAGAVEKQQPAKVDNPNQAVVALREVEPGIVLVTMQDRTYKNAFSEELISDLNQAFDRIGANPGYKVVILTGYDSYFSSGGTKEILMEIHQGRVKYTDTNLYKLVPDCKIPVIAAMQGHAIGGGWCLGMSCDFIVISQESYYTANFMKYGFTPGFGATLIFPEKFGNGLAQEILFTGKKYQGSELEARGISFPVLPRKEVLPYAIQLAKELAESPRESLVVLKDHTAETIRANLAVTIDKELKMHAKTFVNQPGIKARIQSEYSRLGDDASSTSLGLAPPETPKPSADQAPEGQVVKARLNISSGPGGKTGNETPDSSGRDSIAIIGVAGQFPKSQSLTAFWENLVRGRDCVSEIPDHRWPVSRYYDADPKAPGKTCSKWMGVLEEVDRFDPLFFNISPAEAELMDPQQRLFLESCWSCIENAGISPASLSESRCGVFAGCATGEYKNYLGSQGLNAQGLMGTSSSILTARIAYLLNLKGPCLAIDTACSSSLVAIAEACNSLILQNCDLALAGGVCVLAGPEMHIMAGKSGMLSADGRCYTFDNRANGFVPGEGVGVLLLKRLSAAVRDRDPIYGVIRGWGVNQDGKTNGITAPSVNSQIALEKEVYRNFNINPATISLVETHGTGTKLGDPIEVEALVESFRSFTAKKNYCALASVKSNIGHLMTAAGVAGVIKVLLALRNRMLPPTINFVKLNEHIILEDTPFYINSELKPWESEPGALRRAAVSSFGFSGTNAHLVIEEYVAEDLPPLAAGVPQPVLLVLSAKNEEQLKTYAQSMREYIESHEQLNLADLTYTLQVGRDELDYRLALAADSKAALLKALESFCANRPQVGVLSARVEKGKAGMAVDATGEDEDAQLLPETRIDRKKLEKIAEFWVKGLVIDWERLYSGPRPRRLHLPTLPFARERYWIQAQEAEINSAALPGDAIHPLLHRNTSDLTEQRFTTTFTGQEFFLTDHIVNGEPILPGVACLEMARAAVEQATAVRREERSRIKLKNVVWSRPVTVKTGPIQVHIGLYPEADGQIAYEIYSQGQDEADCESNAAQSELVHSQGLAVLSPDREIPCIDIERLKDECAQRVFSASQLYERYQRLGIDYGPAHQGIQAVCLGVAQVLAKLSLPASVHDTMEKYILHPGLMDSALQAALGLMTEADRQPSKPFLPFALEELEVFGSCAPSMWAYIRPGTGNTFGGKVRKLDIDLCDETGKVRVRMKGLASRLLEGDEDTPDFGTVIFQPCWRVQPLNRENLPDPDFVRHLVILCEPEELSAEVVTAHMNQVSCLKLQSAQPEIGARFQEYAAQLFGVIQTLFNEHPKDRALVQVVMTGQGERRLGAGLSGLLKTAYLENPKVIGQLIMVEPGADRQTIIGQLKENSCSPETQLIRYQDGKRRVADFSEMDVSAQALLKRPWKDQGVYLITGGAGGLGLIFAEEITRQTKASTLILTGRSELNEAKTAKLTALEASGARIVYRAVDVTDKNAVGDLMSAIQTEYGDLNGIIHSAGVIRDNFIIKKTPADFLAVLAPKVSGVVNLDQASADLRLDFFIIFSALASFGNPGQSDYATANAFMDAYADYRQTLVAEGRRHGRTLSVNWPLWLEGGMGVDRDTERMMRQRSGMSPMRTASGVEAFYQACAAEATQVLVAEGDMARLREKLFGAVPPELFQAAQSDLAATAGTLKKSDGASDSGVSEPGTIAPDLLRERTVFFFKQLLSSVIKLPVDRIDADAPLEHYGIDSILVMQLNDELEKSFGSLSKTLFFEYQNLRELSGYFLEAHHDQLIKVLGVAAAIAPLKRTDEADALMIKPEKSLLARRRSRFMAPDRETHSEQATVASDIAIIGMAGRYPGARNIEEFWENLKNGKDCITEIPPDRWDQSFYFDADKDKPGKIYSKWGGFLDGVDQFDPLFFNISPHEAELMDPQERLFLQCVYETIEDAGYTREVLGVNRGFGPEGNVGVYVGVMYEEYQLYGAQEQIQGRPVAVSGNPSSIANRVSYFCNFHGPSMAIDTMCSSSLTAIHLACQSLQRGGCELAIAGGVNVTVHPNKYLLLSQGQFISSKGRCESFGQGGDGYVPGEGVGAVLLKPISKAVADGDHVYGIIRATALNHGGKTNGYTVPNPNAQAGVVGAALKTAGINPRTISYIEAHGTGTSLGDPIEITGLTKAFREHTKDQQYCAIGSAKSNIGHSESAAGIAGLTKVLLQLKHGQLAPSLHSATLNPYIDFSRTPFRVQQELTEWKRPLLDMDGATREYPRIAGLSSFGAGGSNAHVLIAEYIPEAPTVSFTVTSQNPAIIVLSARSEEQLKQQARRLLNVIQSGRFAEPDLVKIAYTLQVGREAMEERLALMAASLRELEAKLQGYLGGRPDVDLRRGLVKNNKETLTVFTVDEDLQLAIDGWIAKGKYAQLLDLWVKGLAFDWNRLYPGAKPGRVALPTYPFARERYWISEAGTGSGAALGNTALIHPLLHQNTSDFVEQRFTSRFTGREFFLADHRVNGKSILPGVAYLEMARTAVWQAAAALQEGATRVRLQNIVWSRPLAIEDPPVAVHIGLYPEEDGRIAYEIYGYGNSEANPESPEDKYEPIVYSQGAAVLDAAATIPNLDVETVKARCGQASITSGRLYEVFQAMGLDYGPAHRGVEIIHVGEDQVLAKLILPPAVGYTREQFILHPSLMDSAVQASLGLMLNGGAPPAKPLLPFALEELEVFGGCTPVMWAWIRYSDKVIPDERLQKLDIDLYDDQGRPCVRMKAFTARVLEGGPETAASGTLMLESDWRDQPVDPATLAPENIRRLIFCCELDQAAALQISARLKEARCLSLQAEESIATRFTSYAAQILETLQGILTDKSPDPVLVQIVTSLENESCLCSGLLGLLKTAQLENPKLTGQLIGVEPGQTIETLINQIRENWRSPLDPQVKYKEGKRRVAGWSESNTTAESSAIPWKDEGVYLITGGAGGLGMIFAREISGQVKNATVVLTGRSALDQAKLEQLQKPEIPGAKLSYRQVDVTDPQAVSGLIQAIQEEYGNLSGIIHSAGVIKDNFIIKKTRADFETVLAPKVTGLINLDRASQDLSLDFLVLFSSMAGCFGNPGQADYAAANAFMDAFAHYRNGQVAAGRRHGRTLSINWPLWQEGGMGVGAATERLIQDNIGMIPMRTEAGIQAFYRGWASGRSQVLAAEGNLKRLRQTLLASGKTPSGKSAGKAASVIVTADDWFQEKVENYFKKLLSSVTKLPIQRIEADAPLEKYGIDSVMVMRLTQQLETKFGTLSKTLFFEYQSIRELTRFFLESYPEQLTDLAGFKAGVASTAGPAEAGLAASSQPGRLRKRRSRFPAPGKAARADQAIGSPDIAIIGLAGRYPGAQNVEEFWQNLKEGRDCITEIPPDRWDHSQYFDTDKEKLGKTYSKWGGFIDGVDRFDPLFFNIAPREAEIIDPQERLFLQCVYETLEDAGYTRETLSSDQGLGWGGNVGVYVGVMYEEYQLYGAQEQVKGRPITLAGSPASIANRISYFFNFHGPSLTLDTMCSSSLTAIHLACQNLQRGGCELAIAGGVNLSLHPNKYLALGRGKFVSSKGRCESFGRGGDGYVPGEGVGAVLLKPLSKALADGDQIYGVIKATALNHGGKTNGYTVPNPNAQAEVIGTALKEARISPRMISYIEAHGTGTSLGDPIEITGLTKAFRESTSDKQFCAIGSAKSNIGHCESAAGIAGVTKVLLQLKNKQLAPSLHSQTLNPHIDFGDTPFIVQQELAEWKRPVLDSDSEGIRKECPRIAGISAFGAGGANAHILIAEYLPAEPQAVPVVIPPENPAVIVLSAMSAVQLREQARRLLTAIDERQFTDQNLAEIAYTLQVGREAFEERLGVIVSSLNELAVKLKEFLAGQNGIEDLYQGQLKHDSEALAVFAADEELAKIVETWMARKKYGKILELWVKGLIVNWNKLYSDPKPHRISLPTYPFAKERYWIPELPGPMESASQTSHSNHPFNEVFYERILDEILNETLSIDVAVQKAKKLG